ncbi:redox-sensing transcriptional repressor Rex [Candidatus Poribacteria bacterium]|nr:redox-sensing transcriptional repressor Rex [Candidatus Poribacteria bacterium]
MLQSDDAGGRIPNPVVERLSVYSRVLMAMLRDGENMASSTGLAERTGFSAVQIRRDLTFLGQLGTRGIGYDIRPLHARLEQILGVDVERRVAIVGAGNLGSALTGYTGFREHNFRIVAAFDIEPDRVGVTTQAGVEIHHLDDLGAVAAKENVEIAVLAVPVAGAQSAADVVVRAGIRAILNFAPTVLAVPPGVRLRNVDLSVEMEALSFYLAQRS